MKILFVSQYFPPEPGAPAARIFETAKYWVANGHKVTVLTGFPFYPTGIIPQRYKGKLFIREKIEGIDVLRTWIYATPNQGFFNRIFSFFSFYLSALVTGIFLTGGNDVVIATSPQLLAGLSGYWISFFKQKPFILEVRDLWPQILIDLKIIKNRLAIKLLEWIEMFLYRKARKIIVVTKSFKATLTQRGIPEKKLAFIPNGVDLNGIPSIMQSEDLGFKGKFVVLYLGNFGVSQGLSCIINAAKIIAKSECNNIQFVLVGEGTEREKIIQLRETNNLNNISILAGQPKDQIGRYYACADVCLVPLRNLKLFEKFIPSKIFEIMGFGKPIIASLDGEAKEILADAGCALFAEPDNATQIANAILQLYKDTNLTKALGQKGQIYVQNYYSRKELAKKYLELIERDVK